MTQGSAVHFNISAHPVLALFQWKDSDVHFGVFCRSVWAASSQNITGIAKHWLDKLLQLVVGWINVFFRSNITLTTLPRLMGVCNIYFLPLMSPSAD